MVVYRISNNIHQPLKRVFKPMIPESAASDEDTITPRVCLSLSIEGCIQAVPYSQYIGEGSQIIIYSAKIDDNDPNLMWPEEVQDYVPDAIANSECWYLRPLHMTGVLQRIDHIDVYDDYNMEILNPLYFNGVMMDMLKTLKPDNIAQAETILYDRRLTNTEKFTWIQDACGTLLDASAEWQLSHLLDFCQDEMLYTPHVSKLVLSDINAQSQITTLQYRPLIPAY